MSLFNKFFTGEAQDRKNEFEDYRTPEYYKKNFGFDEPPGVALTNDILGTTPKSGQEQPTNSKNRLTAEQRRQAGRNLKINPTTLNWYPDAKLKHAVEIFPAEVDTVINFFEKNLKLLDRKAANTTKNGRLSRNARNAINEFTRQEKTRLEKAARQRDFLGGTYKKEFIKRVQAAIDELPRKDRKIFNGASQPDPQKSGKNGRKFVSPSAQRAAEKEAKEKTRQYNKAMDTLGINITEKKLPTKKFEDQPKKNWWKLW
jgi:hypothetical protein